MMTIQTTAVAITLLCACVGNAPRAGAAQPLDAQGALQAAYDKQDAAYVRKDAAEIAATYAPGFRVVDQRTGKEEGAAQALDLGFTFATCRPVSSQTTILNMTMQGCKAVITRKSHGVLLMMGASKIETTRLVGEVISVDTWVNSGSGWLQQREEIISGGVGVDGDTAAEQTSGTKK